MEKRKKYERILYQDGTITIVGIYSNPECTDLITVEHRYSNTMEKYRRMVEENGTLKSDREREDKMSYAGR